MNFHRSTTTAEAKPRRSGSDRADREAAQRAEELLPCQSQAGRSHEGAARGDDGTVIQGHPSVVPKQEMQGPVVSDRKPFCQKDIAGSSISTF